MQHQRGVSQPSVQHLVRQAHIHDCLLSIAYRGLASKHGVLVL